MILRCKRILGLNNIKDYRGNEIKRPFMTYLYMCTDLSYRYLRPKKRKDKSDQYITR